MWSGAILAGGRATRFHGRDKGSLVVGGRTIRAHQLHHLSVVTTDILLVGGPPPEPAAAGSADRHVRYVPDRAPGLGPLAGLDAALAAARYDTVAVVACDMPFVTGDFLRFLLTLAAGDVEAVVPRTERGYHPLCAVYSRGCREAVERLIAGHRLRMTALLDAVRVRIVETADIEPFGAPARLLANVNTPADYAALDRL